MSPPTMRDQALLGQAGAADAYEFDDSKLKAYWKFDEGSGTVYNVSEGTEDLGSDADITMNGGTYSVATDMGDLGTGVTFDGTDDSGYCGSNLSQWNYISNTSGLASFFFWAKFLSAPSEETFIGTVYTEGTQIGLLIRIHSTMKMLWHISRGTDATRTISVSSGNNYIPDTTNWHSYCYTYDYGGSPPLHLKRDNANEITGNLASGTNTPSDSNNTYPMQIARRNVPGSEFNAHYSACEWSMWHEVIDSDTQDALYNDGAGREIY